MVLVHLHVNCVCPCPCFMSMLNVHVSVYVHAAHHRCMCVCKCECLFVCVFVFVCLHAGLSSIRSVCYRNKKTNNTGTVLVPDQAKAVRHFFWPVPDWNYWCWNADADVSFLDADVQLCLLLTVCAQIRQGWQAKCAIPIPFFWSLRLLNTASDICAHFLWHVECTESTEDRGLPLFAFFPAFQSIFQLRCFFSLVLSPERLSRLVHLPGLLLPCDHSSSSCCAIGRACSYPLILFASAIVLSNSICLCADSFAIYRSGFTWILKLTCAHSFGQFKKHALLKARTQSPCFSYLGLERAFISAGSADLSSFGGVSVGRAPHLLCWLPVYDPVKMRPVYSIIVGLKDFLSLFCMK